MADRDRIQRLEYDRTRIAQQIAGMAVRRGEGGTGGGEPLPFQLAVVTDAGSGEPVYSGSGLTFEIEHPTVAGRAILLLTEGIDSPVPVDGIGGGATVEDLEFTFINIHRDAPIGVGDVIRVWKDDGSLVAAGEGNVTTPIYGEFFNATEHLRRLDGYTTGVGIDIILHASEDELFWAEGEGTPGAPGATGPTGPTGPAGAAGPGVDPGYAIDVTGTDPRVVEFDATELTDFSAASFQFFAHDTTAGETTNGDDPPWRTVAGYSAIAVCQAFAHFAGSWKCKTLTGYDATDSTQLFGQINDTWHAKTIAEWLELLPNYSFGSNQIIGHAASGPIEWKTLASKVINNPTDIDLTYSTPTLTSNLDYTPVTLLVWPTASDGTPAAFTDTVTATVCP